MPKFFVGSEKEKENRDKWYRVFHHLNILFRGGLLLILAFLLGANKQEHLSMNVYNDEEIHTLHLGIAGIPQQDPACWTRLQ